MAQRPNQPWVELLILANHVEAVNGLLYISGGGWTDHWRPQPPQPGAPVFSHLGIGLAVIVPWESSASPHRLWVAVLDDLGQEVPGTVIATQLNPGRPQGLATGSEQRSVLALALNLVFPHPGEYRVAARVGEDGGERSVSFRVHDVPQTPEDQPPVN